MFAHYPQCWAKSQRLKLGLSLIIWIKSQHNKPQKYFVCVCRRDRFWITAGLKMFWTLDVWLALAYPVAFDTHVSFEAREAVFSLRWRGRRKKKRGRQERWGCCEGEWIEEHACWKHLCGIHTRRWASAQMWNLGKSPPHPPPLPWKLVIISLFFFLLLLY